MDGFSLFVLLGGFCAGLLGGGGLVWLYMRARTRDLQEMINSFKALASDSLRNNNETFLQLAENRFKQSEQAAEAKLDQKATSFDELVKPIRESLQKMDDQLRALELKREGAYRELAQMVTASRETQQQLRNETGQLLQALRAPTGRGRWGELQLQRILEMTGMSVHAHDFATQVTIEDDGSRIRPDVIVNLPGDRCVIIDSKVPLMGYLDATQTTNEQERQSALKQHGRQLRDHIRTLGGKNYWDKVEGTPELVVLFLPGEHFLSAALEADPDLMDYSAGQKVVLATPMTLIALLRTIAYGWRQESLRENVKQIADLGGNLYEALSAFTGHVGKLGSRLTNTIDAYNSMARHLEKTVLGRARQLTDYGAAQSDKELPEPPIIEKQVRQITSKEDAA